MGDLSDLLDFESDSDSEGKGEEALEKDLTMENRVRLHMCLDLFTTHDSTVVKECKYYSEQVNAIISESKLDPSRIKCMEWKSELRMDNLPDDLKPEAFRKCQLNVNKANKDGSQRNPLKICKNYLPRPSQSSKPPPGVGNHFTKGTMPSGNSFSSSQSSNTFTFKPNYNIDDLKNSKTTNRDTAPSVNRTNGVRDNTFPGYNRMDVDGIDSNNRLDTDRPINRNGKDSNIQINGAESNPANLFSVNGVSNAKGHNPHENGTNLPNEQRRDTHLNGASKYFPKPNMPNGKLNSISGFVKDMSTRDSPTVKSCGFVKDVHTRDNASGLDNDDPFSFVNYYKQQENLARTETERRNDRGMREANQGTVLNIINKPGGFRTARTELGIQNMKKDKGRPDGYNNQSYNGNMSSGASANWVSNSIKKTLGTTKARTVNSKFVTPTRPSPEEEKAMDVDMPSGPRGKELEPELEDERYKGIDKVMIERIENEIMDQGKPVTWDDIAGLTFAKQTIQEVIVWPMLRPDIFTGLRRPPKGILLFGPPGTGKTLIGKCVAAQCKATFFCISASTLTSKWYGEGEKMVRALFAVASVHQPSIIFIDEIDSLLCQRSDQENETSRRLKTEFLISLDGASTLDDDLVLVIGATNRPQELDEAARRRLVKRLYIPLPDEQARCEIVTKLLRNITNSLTVDDIEEVGRMTADFSGADMASLCREASLGPVRPISIDDFRDALKTVRPSVCQADLKIYTDWNQTFGSGRC
ncbi:hypothetical protein M8J75_014042 [Diaphorina citri]|nr:hypothetical protein M8J75_014042 [Diaphorina citri]